MSQNNGHPTSLRLKTGLAEMLKGGVIMDVTNAEQAAIAERAGAVAVMALERVPAQIRAEGGVARMASPKKIREIMATVSIPVMAKCRIGHFAEAQILQELGVDYIDESEVLTPADEAHHVDKHAFNVPFVCGARNLGEALRRIAEGAAMIRTKGEAGTGDVVHAVKHIRQIVQEMKILTVLSDQELYAKAKEHGAPYELIKMVAKEGKLPVPNFSAGGIATPADASLVMQLGAEAVFVGSGIFMKNSTEFADPQEAEKRARAIVKAATHYQDPKVLLEVSEDLAGAMKGLAVPDWTKRRCCRRGDGNDACLGRTLLSATFDSDCEGEFINGGLLANVAILVGNTEYQTLGNLSCCGNDVAAVKELIDATDKFESVELLLNKDSAQLKERIRAAIECTTIDRRNILLFHGTWVPA